MFRTDVDSINLLPYIRRGGVKPRFSQNIIFPDFSAQVTELEPSWAEEKSSLQCPEIPGYLKSIPQSEICKLSKNS